MVVCKSSELTTEYLLNDQNNTPLIICTDAPRVRKKIDSAGYKEVQISRDLSKRLLEYSKSERPLLVESLLKNMLDYHDPILITRFEMMFDPRYEIDLIKVFCEKARTINVAVKWPGQLVDNKLIYANIGDPDYHEYECNSYQIRVVK